MCYPPQPSASAYNTKTLALIIIAIMRKPNPIIVKYCAIVAIKLYTYPNNSKFPKKRELESKEICAPFEMEEWEILSQN